MKILCLGDIVGPQAVEHISKNLWNYRRQNDLSLVVANGENADEGNGISMPTAEKLLSRGIDVLTSGNHIWKKKDVYSFLDDSSYIIRPVNYPGSNPGKGCTIVDANGYRVLVINVQGTAFMEALADPFDSVDKTLRENAGNYDFAILDIHAEATSEKLALAHYFDGRISVIFGTHTHVPTADAKILPKGSGYITDLGMCGVQDGILGVEPEIIINRFRSKMPARFALKKGDPLACGALFELDADSGRVGSVKRVEF